MTKINKKRIKQAKPQAKEPYIHPADHQFVEASVQMALDTLTTLLASIQHHSYHTGTWVKAVDKELATNEELNPHPEVHG